MAAFDTHGIEGLEFAIRRKRLIQALPESFVLRTSDRIRAEARAGRLRQLFGAGNRHAAAVKRPFALRRRHFE